MINLNSSEKKTIIFTAVILVVSGLYQWIQPNKINQSTFDYSKPDSIFNRLSHRSFDSGIKDKSIDSTANLEDKKPSRKSQRKKKSINKNKTKLLPASININTASEIELQKLPRIGPKIAKRIIDYRENTGEFKSINDLQKVKGIGKKTFEKLAVYIYVM